MSVVSEVFSHFRSSRLAEVARPAVHGVQSVWKNVMRYPLYLCRFGLEGGDLAYEKLHNNRENTNLTRVKIPQVDSDILIRPWTTDVHVFEQVFLDLEYSFDLPSAPKSIVDAGAHIGLASLYFAHRYPKCEILAIEPEPKNFQLLKENTQYYTNIKTIQAGLWKKSTSLEITDTNSNNWCFQVEEEEDQDGIPAMTVSDTRNCLDVECLDVLKMDIEGAEKEVLSKCHSWFSHVGTVIVELHGKQRMEGSTAIQEAMKSFDIEKKKFGENVVLTRR